MKTRRDGSVYLSFKTNQMNKLCSWILSFGGEAKVLNPPELREQVKAAAKKILKANS
jgi:predicted DNA-binding transcriptional regulator YafY